MAGIPVKNRVQVLRRWQAPVLQHNHWLTVPRLHALQSIGLWLGTEGSSDLFVAGQLAPGHPAPGG